MTPRPRSSTAPSPGLSSRANALLTELYAHTNPKNVAGMARYGITSKNVLGLTAPYLRQLRRSIGTDHELALQLWSSGVYEARILAAMIADPARMTASLMTAWAREFDNWAICDGVCIHLFNRTAAAHRVASAWSRRQPEFVRRAGFTMMATLAVHDKDAGDAVFKAYLRRIMQTATDERNGVKKAINWALRQIGKRNMALNEAAVRTAKTIQRLESAAARWIAADALRELQSPAVQKRLKRTTR
jgi:3-methyladenine DNA glycosylase AlkD